MTPIHPAPLQLADLAAVMRPDWDRGTLEGAVAAARTSGWSWPKVFSEVARLLVMEDSSPHDLTVASRNQITRTAADPSLTKQWAADCRQFLKTRSAS